MAKQFDDVSGRYGAHLGRHEWRGDPDAPYKFRLFRVRLDAGGYDDGGAYWGLGGPLYCAQADAVWCGDVQADADACRHFVRAKSREVAKAAILVDYPNAKFFK